MVIVIGEQRSATYKKRMQTCFIGIGQIKNCEPRVRVIKELERLDFIVQVMKAKSAYISTK